MSQSPSLVDGNKNFSRTPTSWDTQDDILLMHLKDQQKLGWKEIASHFTNRTPNACQFRWRRLKSGNLKNPPKSVSSAGKGTPTSSVGSGQGQSGSARKDHKGAGSDTKSESPGHESNSVFASYSPINASGFTGYGNINGALAGLNALSNTPSSISSPVPSNNAPGSHSGGLNSPNSNAQTVNHYDSPGSDLLDPQAHQNSTGSSGGGYYADISVDPTMNLPHVQLHPNSHVSLIGRNSHSHEGTANNLVSTIHNNSIIQISKDDRNSISLTRASISSLPSKSMNIPHHQTNNSALAHLPIPFGSGGSISGPSRAASISGPAGILGHATISSIRNGSVFGGLGYYSRSGSIVIPHNADKKDPDDEKNDLKKELEKKSNFKISNNAELDGKSNQKNSQPVFKIPWSMEEDELLINRRNRELSFAELSILLPQRTEGEIWSRIDYLERLKNGHRSSSSRGARNGRRSSVGLDDVDFYDEAVMDGIDVSDDDEADDDVLVDVDDSPKTTARKRKKRRTSSAVNPLAVPLPLKKNK